MNDTESLTREQAFAELRRRNITKVTVHFSGGNDEGGAESIVAVSADGAETDLLVNPEVYQDWDTKKWVVGYGDNARPATEDEIASKQLAETLEAPVYHAYGGFAGDFSVSGTVTWDVATGKVVMAKRESVERYDESEDEV